MVRFFTAGESHGQGLVIILEGVPAGLSISEDYIGVHLARRQKGYGRGGRMLIEQDRAKIISGVRHGHTLGSPIGMTLENKDWANWQEAMAIDPLEGEPQSPRTQRITRLRPGHADLPGAMKYGFEDVRNVLERASARETAARVACGAVCKKLLADFGITIGSHVTSIGAVEARVPEELPEDLNGAVDASPLRTLDDEAAALMVEAIDQAKEDGDTLGGIFEVVVRGLPAGLGSYVSYDSKLDGRLAGAMMSIQAIKGVEIGVGFEGARRPGSEVHDPIVTDESASRAGGIGRSSNRAGGLEGGMTTGEPLVVRAAMKPISTLRKRLPSVDMRDGSAKDAAVERSDVWAVPAAAVVGEAMVALVLADAFLEKFGGDAMSEVRRNFESYIAYLGERGYGER